MTSNAARKKTANKSNVAMRVIRAAMAARRPVMMVGPPGVGKTEVIRSMARRMGYNLITLLGSRMEPTDVTGLPTPVEFTYETVDGTVETHTVTDMAVPYWQHVILRDKKVILFFDEFSNTPPATRASLLTLFQNRIFGNGTPLPQECIVIGAMNPAEEAADGFALDGPTTNRMLFIEWSPTVSEWLEGMAEAWGNKNAPKEEMFWRRKVIKFIDESPTWLQRPPSALSGNVAVHGVDPNNASAVEVFQAAFPTRRSWDELCRVLGASDDDHDPIDKSETVIVDEIAKGMVGHAASAAFREWLMRNDSIDYREALADPSSVDWDNITLNDSNLLFRAIVDGVEDSEMVMSAVELFTYVATVAKRTDLAANYIRDFITNAVNKRRFTPDEFQAHQEAVRPLMTLYSGSLKGKRGNVAGRV